MSFHGEFVSTLQSCSSKSLSEERVSLSLFDSQERGLRSHWWAVNYEQNDNSMCVYVWVIYHWVGVIKVTCVVCAGNDWWSQQNHEKNQLQGNPLLVKNTSQQLDTTRDNCFTSLPCESSSSLWLWLNKLPSPKKTLCIRKNFQYKTAKLILRKDISQVFACEETTAVNFLIPSQLNLHFNSRWNSLFSPSFLSSLSSRLHSSTLMVWVVWVEGWWNTAKWAAAAEEDMVVSFIEFKRNTEYTKPEAKCLPVSSTSS